MKALDDIIEGAVDNSISLSSLLRKCLVVADRLKNEKLKAWVRGELNGYDDKENLPPFRIMRIQAVGMFIGPNYAMQDQPLSPASMKEAHREWATTAYLMQGVAAYEELIRNNDSIGHAWPAQIVAIYQRSFIQNATLIRASQRIPKASLAGVLDTVRNKLLEFALELREEIGEQEPTPQNPPPEKVEQQVTNIIYGGNVVIGNVEGSVNQAVMQVIAGDFKSLSAALTSLGIPEDHLPALKEALEADTKDGHVDKIGPKADGWIKSTVKAVGRTGLKVTEAVAAKVASTAILEYLSRGGSLL